MSVEDLKWYHWFGIGLAVGAAAGGLRVAFGDRWADTPFRTIGQAEFESSLVRTQPDGKPTVDQVVIHPPDADGVWWVTGRRQEVLALHADPADALGPRVDTEVRTPFKFPAAFPYLPSRSGSPVVRPNEGDRSVAGFLRRLHEAMPDVVPVSTYAWYEPPAVRVALWTIGFGILLGGLWPPVLALLIGAGLGRPRAEQPYDLDRFAAEGQAKAAAAHPVGDIDAVLDALTAAQDAADPGRTAEPPAAGPPVRLLPDAPEPLQAVPEHMVAAKSYGGDFYPTVMHPVKPPPDSESARSTG